MQVTVHLEKVNANFEYGRDRKVLTGILIKALEAPAVTRHDVIRVELLPRGEDGLDSIAVALYVFRLIRVRMLFFVVGHDDSRRYDLWHRVTGKLGYRLESLHFFAHQAQLLRDLHD